MPHFVIKSIPITTRIASAASAGNILARDQARARKFLQGVGPFGPKIHHQRKHHHHHKHEFQELAANVAGSGSVDVTDASVTYTMSVGVGSPATDYTLLIDTGSSNTWIGAQKSNPYTPTSTSTDTRKTVNVSYGSGSFSGTEYTDQVTLAPGLVIQNQSIGVASTATGFDDVDGIIGIGPVDLTSTTVSGVSSVPTVTDNLFSQGTIPVESIGISYVPTTSANAQNGELTFGGTDSSKFTGDITYVPITSTSPASEYWGVDQSVTYGQDGTSILSLTSGIVDTGTTLLLLATEAFQAYQSATGATSDSTTGLLKITEDQYNNLQSLFFTLGDTTLELTPNAQIWPRSLNSTLGGDDGSIYLITSDLGSSLGQGLDFIDGFGFLQRFYTVFDTTNSQVGHVMRPLLNLDRRPAFVLFSICMDARGRGRVSPSTSARRSRSKSDIDYLGSEPTGARSAATIHRFGAYWFSDTLRRPCRGPGAPERSRPRLIPRDQQADSSLDSLLQPFFNQAHGLGAQAATGHAATPGLHMFSDTTSAAVDPAEHSSRLLS
uniref:Acid protease n=1 Tax=Mycena chlorophos TaxID=658473 RepID=A0ABQ0LDV1_MYCCL|nr:acid protease [Mycena chlorophos]